MKTRISCIMNTMAKKAGIAMVHVAIVATLGAGTVFAVNAYSNRNLASFPVFPRNARGETYGSGAAAGPGLVTPWSEPDLILAQSVDGTIGYVMRTDLEGPQPKTPQEAIALTKYNLAHPTREIPLYAVDGKTIIGNFIVGGE